MQTTYKTSVSLQNKSDIINKALNIYFDRERFFIEKEKEYWDLVEKSIANKDSDYISLNSNGEKIDDQILEEKLWK